MDALTAALEARPVRDSLRSFLGRDDTNCEITRSVGALVQGSGGIPVYWTNESDFEDIRLLTQGPMDGAGIDEKGSARTKEALLSPAAAMAGGHAVGTEVVPARKDTIRYYASHTAPPPRWACQKIPTYIRALYKR
jgi:hypothetical protein